LKLSDFGNSEEKEKRKRKIMEARLTITDIQIKEQNKE
jgi:hypothetical protein